MPYPTHDRHSASEVTHGEQREGDETYLSTTCRNGRNLTFFLLRRTYHEIESLLQKQAITMTSERPTADEIKTKTLEWLNGTRFAADSIEPLSGGTANFIYRARLRQPLVEATTEVIIKHGEGFVASSPDFSITTDRCVRQERSLYLEQTLIRHHRHWRRNFSRL